MATVAASSFVLARNVPGDSAILLDHMFAQRGWIGVFFGAFVHWALVFFLSMKYGSFCERWSDAGDKALECPPVP